jgi:hypothetical protein
VDVWDTLAYHKDPVTKPFMRTIPYLFRGLFMRNLYGWIVALRLSKRYDVILMRHMTFDPFALVFAPLIRNRISLHHAKEVEELRLISKGWKGRAASALERLTGRVAARHALGLLGVTQEIAEYERDLHAPEKAIGVYPNGVNTDQIPLIDDHRSAGVVDAAFICGKFSAWHGLDKLIAAVDVHLRKPNESFLKIHLIGQLSDVQKREIAATETRREVFQAHGLMDSAEYRHILARCDIGIASLALERESLREGSTLKVREMLAMGLAVYSGHSDIAMPPEQPFVKIVESPNIAGFVEFGMLTKTLSREIIRERSIPNIGKISSMASTLER